MPGAWALRGGRNDVIVAELERGASMMREGRAPGWTIDSPWRRGVSQSGQTAPLLFPRSHLVAAQELTVRGMTILSHFTEAQAAARQIQRCQVVGQ